MATKYQVTAKSRNTKTGPIMVTTTSSDTCPDVCPFKGGACYAKNGPLALVWRNVDQGKGNVTDLRGLCEAVADLPENSLWRHNQAGDLPGEGDKIDHSALSLIAVANVGRRGFTYTHKPVTGGTRTAINNREAVRSSNACGFTVNLSANNLAHADELADMDIGPVVVVLPIEQVTNTTTPQGRKVVVCPAVIRDDVSCATCGLCQKQREAIVGFPAHGAAKKKANAIAGA